MNLGTDPHRFLPGLDSATYAPATAWAPALAADRGEARRAQRHRHRPGRPGRAAGELPGSHYAVVGPEPSRRSWKRWPAERGVADRVRFLTRCSDADLPALYNARRAVPGPVPAGELLIEGFGISLTEASACGIPIVGGRARRHSGRCAGWRDRPPGGLTDPARSSPRSVATRRPRAPGGWARRDGARSRATTIGTGSPPMSTASAGRSERYSARVAARFRP